MTTICPSLLRTTPTERTEVVDDIDHSRLRAMLVDNRPTRGAEVNRPITCSSCSKG
jgi:hypothetical protein